MSGNLSDANSPEANPFAAPRATDSVVVDADLTAPEAIRWKHLNREYSVRGLGLLCYMGAILLIPGSIYMATQGTERPGIQRIFCGINCGIGVVSGVLGWGIRSLSGWARLVAILVQLLSLLSLLWLFGSVTSINLVGLMINGYILWLLTGEKGKFVFSSEYRAIRQTTPHIRKKTSIFVWFLLGLFVLVIVAAVI